MSIGKLKKRLEIILNYIPYLGIKEHANKTHHEVGFEKGDAMVD